MGALWSRIWSRFNMGALWSRIWSRNTLDQPDRGTTSQQSTEDQSKASSRKNKDRSQESDDQEATTSQTRSTRSNTKPLEYYRMDRKPRGLCVIINNVDFKNDPEGVKKRSGSDIDRGKLVETFESLDFKTRPHDNLTADRMLEVLKGVANESHDKFDCLVCCVLTHGRSGGIVCGVDEQEKKIGDMTDLFKGKLIGKPKLFFIQACRGGNICGAVSDNGKGQSKKPGSSGKDGDHVPSDKAGDKHHELGSSGQDRYYGHSNLDEELEGVLEEQDFLIGYSTPPNYMSIRYPNKGSWYITALVEKLKAHASTHELVQILTEVNKEVAEQRDEIEKKVKGELVRIPVRQMPTFTSQLTKGVNLTGKRELPSGLQYRFAVLYARNDVELSLPFAKYLTENLEAIGWTPGYYDSRDSLPGSSLVSSKMDEIKQSQFVICVLTDTFLKSAWDRYFNEASFGNILENTENEQFRCVIPIMLHDDKEAIERAVRKKSSHLDNINRLYVSVGSFEDKDSQLKDQLDRVEKTMTVYSERYLPHEGNG